MTLIIPPLPPKRGYEGEATSEIRPRYEDITQDGRVQLTTLMPGLSAVWRTLGHLAEFRAQGVLPILARLVIVGEDGPFSVHTPFVASGTWRLARETNGERLFFDMWLEVHAPIGYTLAAPPPKDAERVLLGRMYAEHVITRPFGPPAERKVTRLAIKGLPELPEDEHPFESAEPIPDVKPVRELTFGMMHTDSNQHVNSLVYPRLFEEAADQPQKLARAIEMRYRKPFFVGDRARISMTDDRTKGVFTPLDSEKPSVALAMRLA